MHTAKTNQYCLRQAKRLELYNERGTTLIIAIKSELFKKKCNTINGNLSLLSLAMHLNDLQVLEKYVFQLKECCFKL